jgi:DNA-binding NtrC family response regulator
LARYLPTDNSRLPVAYAGAGNADSSDFSEREILYKVLFDMKKDMNELKKLVLESYQSGGLNQNIIKKHQNLFEDMESHVTFEEEAKPKSTVPLVIDNSHKKQDDLDYEDPDIEDILHEEDDNSLSIEKKEKELITRALKKHNNKRKYAAMDLGISERTLYRKIKQYDISD